MVPSSEAVPVGATPAGVFDIACRVAESGGSLPPEITEAARAVAGELGSFPPDEVRGALERIITSPNADDGLQWLHDAGALGQVLPELDATVNLSQESGRRHKDVWEHTKQVVMQSPAQPIVRWAALLHDVGKVDTRVMLGDGKVTAWVFLAPSASASAFSSSIICAPTPTSRSGPTQPCVASITKWETRSPSS